MIVAALTPMAFCVGVMWIIFLIVPSPLTLGLPVGATATMIGLAFVMASREAKRQPVDPEMLLGEDLAWELAARIGDWAVVTPGGWTEQWVVTSPETGRRLVLTELQHGKIEMEVSADWTSSTRLSYFDESDPELVERMSAIATRPWTR